MAEYKELRGLTIQTVAGDPSPLQIGDIWYSSTTRKIRGAKRATGAWSTGGALTTGHRNMGLTGPATAAMCMGGLNTFITNTEQYDGSSWTEVADLNQGVEYNVAFGTQTAAVHTGGIYGPPNLVTNNTETWNGASWTTSPANMNTARQKMSAANLGTTTAGLIFAGMFEPSVGKTVVESWDGSAWTEIADISTARSFGQGGGIQTAAFLAGGYTSPPGVYYAVHETWDGSSWTEAADINTDRQAGGSSGTVTSALIYAGRKGSPGPPGVNVEVCEQWDGTSWTEVADLSITRQGCGRGTGATGYSALCCGFDGSPNTATEEWDAAVTASSFTSS